MQSLGHKYIRTGIWAGIEKDKNRDRDSHWDKDRERDKTKTKTGTRIKTEKKIDQLIYFNFAKP